jgi:hypothetical protein
LEVGRGNAKIGKVKAEDRCQKTDDRRQNLEFEMGKAEGE